MLLLWSVVLRRRVVVMIKGSIDAHALDVQRLLCVALSDWYSWLGAQSVRREDWRGVPGWCKGVPGSLDLPWALHDLPGHVGNRQMLEVLSELVERVRMSSSRVEGVPSVERLDEAVKSLLEVLDG